MTYIGILVLYIIFRFKQLICDFFLQNAYMVKHKHMPWRKGGAKALFTHAGIHATFTLVIVMLYAPSLWWIAPLDFVIHATIDRIKAILTHRKSWSYKDNMFWWVFGLDQEAHNFSHLLYIVIIMSFLGISA